MRYRLLALENVAYLLDLPHAPLRQTNFFHRLVAATGCGVLLDVANVYVNAVNHGFDPVAFLEAMPLDRVIHVHLAGGYWEDGLLIDSHTEPIADESWRLYQPLVELADVRAVIVEHDRNFPPLRALLDQVSRAREILLAHRSSENDRAR